MDEQISKLKSLILHSDELLTQDCVSKDEYVSYKNACDACFALLVNRNISYTISELAKLELDFKVKRISNPFYRWIYYQLTTARDDITYNAPYLKQHTESAYNKQYIFWTKKRLGGILLNLERLNRT